MVCSCQKRHEGAYLLYTIEGLAESYGVASTGTVAPFPYAWPMDSHPLYGRHETAFSPTEPYPAGAAEVVASQ